MVAPRPPCPPPTTPISTDVKPIYWVSGRGGYAAVSCILVKLSNGFCRDESFWVIRTCQASSLFFLLTLFPLVFPSPSAYLFLLDKVFLPCSAEVCCKIRATVSRHFSPTADYGVGTTTITTASTAGPEPNIPLVYPVIVNAFPFSSSSFHSIKHRAV